MLMNNEEKSFPKAVINWSKGIFENSATNPCKLMIL